MGGETHTIAVTIAAPLGFPLGVFTGTIKLRNAAGGGGGVSAQPLDLTLTIVEDVTLPVVAIAAPETGSAFAASPIAVSGSLDDPFATLALNGEAVAVSGGQWSASVDLEEGNNVITAVATDQVGNIGTATIEAVLDTRAPVVTIDSPPDGFVTNQTVIDVAGMINDIVVGTVSGDSATVTVNGIMAEVDNRGYLAQGVPLQPGPNTITALGEDAAGNLASAAITVTFDAMAGEPQIRLVSGNNQTGAIATELPAPLVVALEDALGLPVAGETVIFKVIENNGTLSGGGRAGVASVAVATDALGQAAAPWTLGTRAGAGNNLTEAMAVGFSGGVLFTASALAAAPDKINADAGNNQTGAAAQPLALPFVAVVTDAGHNRLAGVAVTFSVVQGDGSFNGLANLTVDTDASGRAVALLTLGPEEGFDNNVVEADFAGLVGLPTTFVATGKVAGDPAATSVSGVVLDNSDNPVPGVTLSIEGTALSAQSDAQGQFTIANVAPGPIVLLADGSTTTRPGTWPALEFELVAVPGQDNRLERPVYLLPLDTANQLCVDDATGGTLALPEVPGFALNVEAGSASFPGGATAGCLTVTPVHADKVPMTPNFGQQPRFIVTIQPAGVLFDPPAPLSLPNTDGLAPGAVTELYSFDHDLGQFVSIGTGTVTPDGTTVASDPGVGIVKSGWASGGDPDDTGDAENASVGFTSVPMTIFLPPGDDEPITAQGGPFPGVFSWESGDSSVLSVDETSTTGSTTATPVAAGTTNVIVTYTAQSGVSDSATAQVTVVPVPITAGGTATFDAISLAGPKDEKTNQPPDPAQIITTNFPVFQANATDPPFLEIPQWVNNGPLLAKVTGLGFDWFEKQMIEILGQIALAGGDLDRVMNHILEIQVIGLPVGVFGQVSLDHRISSIVKIDPFFNSARLNTVPGDIVCGKAIGKHLTTTIIHEGRHSFQNFITTIDLEAPDENPVNPDNDDDRDFLVDKEDILASANLSGIFLDTTDSRTVCDQGNNNLLALSYEGDSVLDDLSKVKFAIEYDARVFADFHD